MGTGSTAVPRVTNAMPTVRFTSVPVERSSDHRCKEPRYENGIYETLNTVKCVREINK